MLLLFIANFNFSYRRSNNNYYALFTSKLKHVEKVFIFLKTVLNVFFLKAAHFTFFDCKFSVIRWRE